MTISQFKKQIEKYLPGFVIVNDLVKKIFYAVSISLSTIDNEIENLQNADYTGRGLRLTADSNDILYKSDATDEYIQNELNTMLDILSSRGSEEGIANDLSNLDLVLDSTLEFIGLNNTGWILDVTYPEIPATKIQFLDAYKIVKLNFATPFSIGFARIGQTRIGQNTSQYVKAINPAIKEKIIPIDCQIIYS